MNQNGLETAARQASEALDQTNKDYVMPIQDFASFPQAVLVRKNEHTQMKKSQNKRVGGGGREGVAKQTERERSRERGRETERSRDREVERQREREREVERERQTDRHTHTRTRTHTHAHPSTDTHAPVLAGHHVFDSCR